MYTILLVDDDKEVLEVNRLFFEKKDCHVCLCDNPANVLQMLQNKNPDCAVLDVMMPQINGYSLCRQIRKISNIPVIFLSGRVSEDDKIKGFSCGADDYVEKPYSLTELYVRIISNIKRNQAVSGNTKNNLMQRYPLSVDLIEHKVYCQQEEVFLSNREYDLLLMLIAQPGACITFEQIGKKMWGSYCEEDRRSVMVIMSRLRKKFLSYHGMENKIETVWSHGYKFT